MADTNGSGPEQLTLEAIEASIAATVAPLKEQLRLVEGRERLILADLEETRTMKARLLSTLRKLDPSMSGPGRKPGPKPKQGSEESRKQAVAEVIQAIDELAYEYPDGFTRNKIHSHLQTKGIGMGDNRLRVAVDDLHASGYLTLNKIVTGGNKNFKRTEDMT